MKYPLRHLKQTVFLLAIFAVTSHQAFAFEPQALVLPHIEVIIPGVTRTITIIQDEAYPQGVDTMMIIAIGYGGVTIDMTPTSETPQEGNLLMLTGVGISSAGIVPVLKFGKTDGSLTAAVEVGNERLPFGVVWIASWVNSSENDPPYEYQLFITAFLDFYSEL